jgi:hypothetical protein
MSFSGSASRLRFMLPALDCGVVQRDAAPPGESTQRHDIDRLSDRTEHNDGGQDRQRDGGRDDHGATPTAQKRENHEGGQARAICSLTTPPIAPRANRLISKGCCL